MLRCLCVLNNHHRDTEARSLAVTGVTGEALGVLVALGDVPLESVTPETYGVTGLTNIIPPADYFEAATLSRRNRAGFALDKIPIWRVTLIL